MTYTIHYEWAFAFFEAKSDRLGLESEPLYQLATQPFGFLLIINILQLFYLPLVILHISADKINDTIL